METPQTRSYRFATFITNQFNTQLKFVLPIHIQVVFCQIFKNVLQLFTNNQSPFYFYFVCCLNEHRFLQHLELKQKKRAKTHHSHHMLFKIFNTHKIVYVPYVTGSVCTRCAKHKSPPHKRKENTAIPKYKCMCSDCYQNICVCLLCRWSHTRCLARCKTHTQKAISSRAVDVKTFDNGHGNTWSVLKCH